MELKLKKSITETYVLSVYGELDLYNAQKLRELVLKMMEKGVTRIVFDMRETDYLDATGLGSLIYFFNISRKNPKIKFCMCHVTGTVRRLIDLGIIPSHT